MTKLEFALDHEHRGRRTRLDRYPTAAVAFVDLVGRVAESGGLYGPYTGRRLVVRPIDTEQR